MVSYLLDANRIWQACRSPSTDYAWRMLLGFYQWEAVTIYYYPGVATIK